MRYTEVMKIIKKIDSHEGYKPLLLCVTTVASVRGRSLMGGVTSLRVETFTSSRLVVKKTQAVLILIPWLECVAGGEKMVPYLSHV